MFQLAVCSLNCEDEPLNFYGRAHTHTHKQRCSTVIPPDKSTNGLRLSADYYASFRQQAAHSFNPAAAGQAGATLCNHHARNGDRWFTGEEHTGTITGGRHGCVSSQSPSLRSADSLMLPVCCSKPFLSVSRCLPPPTPPQPLHPFRGV